MADVEVTEQVRAEPSVVYDLVSDVTRMGSWSPETTSCRWLGGATGPAVGARFRGTNRRGPLLRWTTTCTVTAAEPGRRFAFDVDFAGVPIARWAYDLEPTPTGCTVTESWDDRRGRPLQIASVPLMGIADRAEHNRRSMQTTLTALRLAAEG
ncbi:MAG: SRPBCC family protein [Spirochaetaceae bacterium]|nr:SRPBCC family protein [Spirochaetaceae bacterium]